MSKFAFISALLLALASCGNNYKSETKNTQKEVTKISNNNYKDENGWIIMSKVDIRDYVNELKIVENGPNTLNVLSTMGEAPKDWLKYEDLEFLITLIESKERANCVMRVISSHIPNPQNMTIGNQAISIIESYRQNQTYPNGLTVCESYEEEKVQEIRKWWTEKKR